MMLEMKIIHNEMILLIRLYHTHCREGEKWRKKLAE